MQFYSSGQFSVDVMRIARKAKLNENSIAELRKLTDQHMHIQIYCDKFEAAFLLKEEMQFQINELIKAQKAAIQDMMKNNGMRDGDVTRSIMDQIALYQAWMSIAYRDSVMTISHFDDALKALNKALNIQNKNSDQSVVNRTTAPRKWNKTFVDAFPEQKHARNTVAHEAENFAQRARSESNAINEPFELGNAIKSDGAQITMVGCMIDDGITYSRDGKILTSRLDQAGVTALKDCLRQIEEYLISLVTSQATD